MLTHETLIAMNVIRECQTEHRPLNLLIESWLLLANLHNSLFILISAIQIIPIFLMSRPTNGKQFWQR